jgi:dihydroorotate dehydrogenase electron transfer subunit
MKKTVCDLTVTSNIQLNHDNYLLRLHTDKQLGKIIPGQFVNILVPGSPGTFLRRPFSVFDVNYAKNTLSVLLKAVGRGTHKLSLLQKGQRINALFPLGNGFTLPQKQEKILLVGGGVGIAPMMLMAKESKEIGAEVNILLGAQTRHDHILIDQFSKLGSVYITTDDGSLGTKGFVTHHPVLKNNGGFSQVYCCGPDPMMKAVAKLSKTRGTECEVSLENTMACGFGVCLCCVTKTKNGNKCVCTEGPVFNVKDLSWQI